ncbi:MAG: T9SS type A sorting domain-containing protein [Flavobacteriaceae bacterium]|nr:T9SS type A sorting domain-containing protein [Flavobacteriaceae bacterium]
MKTKILILLALLYLGTSNSQVTYVNIEAQGLNNGTSWEDAYTDLDFAIENTPIGDIWVSAGIYYPSTDLDGNIPTNETLKTFRFKKDIAIYGGFIGNETSINQRDWVNNETILSGNIGLENEITDNVRHVVSSEYVNLDEDSILDGLTISDGYSYYQYEGYNGGGIYVNQTSGGKFILRNCIIENNFSYRNGGGLYVFNSDPIIENNTFQNNKSFKGGAMFLSYSNALVKNNIIIDNIADDYDNVSSTALSGGGIFVFSYSSPTIINNLIKGNFAKYEGGGVTIDSNYHTIFQGNFVTENTSIDGGGMYLDFSETYFFNNIFTKNLAIENGGAIYMDYTPGGPEFINNTLSENTANQEGGALYLASSNINIVNSIVYYNIPSNNQIRAGNGSNWTPKIRYCNIENGENGIVSTGNPIIFENNLDEIPMFVNVNENDYSLEAESILINSGTTSPSIVSSSWIGSNNEIVEFPSIDYAGNPRIINNIDIGAYEFNSNLSIPTNELQNFAFYPNPSTGIFYFNSQLNFESITIFDINGRKIKTIYKESNKNSINLSNYNNGIYITIIKINGIKYYNKIILNR